MKLSECDALLRPEPLPLETGYERLPDGSLHVACRTDLHGCGGAMLEWWFRFRPDTQQYVWWHPVDHLSSAWAEARPGTHLGSIHLVEERLTALPAQKLAVQFIEPAELFEPGALAEARARGHLTGAVCGRTSEGHPPRRDGQGRLVGGRLLHLARDTAWGCALRSHFFLGADLPALGLPPAALAEAFPDALGQALLQHCYNEFTFLSRFLPSLYLAENRHQVAVPLPW